MENKERLHELDSLRGLAALGVVAWHYTNHMKASPLSFIFAPFYKHGLLMVDFFFVLSGYVLARAYWNETRSEQPIRNLGKR
ncbi:acyltransferase family protein [Burkholderia multivorans]|uniref:acyltransferase family protein n=1 Tax=Burkholderia multivorans TaxID=87883 RepID=UPI00201A035C|nr:acyltransferase family protein [Burkholderia multivorans]MCO1384488.1 acyltransferase family protein [Burkholderia multivorans]UQO81067.1 acyltransferase family protein [Burkholderia multivorans]